ncbi:MAG: BatA domain-containing protein [Candidatus Cloacimonetes bacterium]|nr:BatA domain-containing protein [Candidatus Cloacimonadota bacterium]
MFGISFLNSGILFLTAAIILPVLIYLFARKKPHRIVFSSIRFIKESQQKQRK